MSKILITGNGFDLFHHLPTKYGHFMAIMETIEKFQFKGDYVGFEELFGEFFKKKFPLEYDLICEHYFKENLRFENKRLREIDGLLKENNWYQYFKSVLELETWIDFEKEIEYVLRDMSAVFNWIKSTPNNVESYNKFSVNVYRNFSYFNFVEEDDDVYLKFKADYVDKNNKILKERKILVEQAKSLEGFISIFNQYLVSFVGGFYSEIKKKYLMDLKSINQIYTFNYTSTLEKIYNVDVSKITYLHGKSNEDESLQNLVLGVSEIPNEIKSNKMYDFAKYYQKIDKNSNYRFIKIPENTTNRLNETVFYVIGHSLDESDKDYIVDLFTFLKYDLKKKSKICIFYFNESDKQNKVKNLFGIIDKETVVDLNKEKRLYFVELNEKNIENEFNRTLYKNPPGIQMR